MSHDWIVEGAAVVELTRRYSQVSAHRATVARLTATQVVLDNGNRYRRKNLRRVEGEDGSWTHHEIVRPNDKSALDAMATDLVRRLNLRLDRLTRNRIGMAGVSECLDAIEAACANVRAQIAAWTEEANR